MDPKEQIRLDTLERHAALTAARAAADLVERWITRNPAVTADRELRSIATHALNTLKVLAGRILVAHARELEGALSEEDLEEARAATELRSFSEALQGRLEAQERVERWAGVRHARKR